MLRERLRRYLAQAGLPAGEVARRAGLSSAAFRAMLAGTRRITAEEYLAICRALDVPPGRFARRVPPEADGAR